MSGAARFELRLRQSKRPITFAQRGFDRPFSETKGLSRGTRLLERVFFGAVPPQA
ncbi:hypothetical protein [Chenggangzhangella methanolivorans]|uniref:Uncharacterized protein n=1 Tax=Chenggangzhangella methanolivorans TaxID=1437009 RepID=A0A9E6RGH7_9HYPH|nr:hypothetical protein [Chenggangzhangella methanolivorans]QZO01011.1 hypothetical protein K6K41_05235 [Chenggangzhangella methanolivorans]